MNELDQQLRVANWSKENYYGKLRALQQTKKELQHDGQDARQAKEELGTTLRNTKWRYI